MNRQSAEVAARPTCGRRGVVPSVCIVDAKQHIRAFLGTALERSRKLLSSDELFVIRYAAPESSTGGCRDVET